MRSLFIIISVILCVQQSFAVPGKGLRQATTVTSTATEFVTVSTTSVTVITDVCAKLVNATTACRRRKGLPIEEPVVMVFNEGLDDVENFFSPTAPLR